MKAKNLIPYIAGMMGSTIADTFEKPIQRYWFKRRVIPADVQAFIIEKCRQKQDIKKRNRRIVYVGSIAFNPCTTISETIMYNFRNDVSPECYEQHA